jgi:hypothetical protein
MKFYIHYIEEKEICQLLNQADVEKSRVVLSNNPRVACSSVNDKLIMRLREDTPGI